jgi:hypothetical protein
MAIPASIETTTSTPSFSLTPSKFSSTQILVPISQIRYKDDHQAGRHTHPPRSESLPARDNLQDFGNDGQTTDAGRTTARTALLIILSIGAILAITLSVFTLYRYYLDRKFKREKQRALATERAKQAIRDSTWHQEMLNSHFRRGLELQADSSTRRTLEVETGPKVPLKSLRERLKEQIPRLPKEKQRDNHENWPTANNFVVGDGEEGSVTSEDTRETLRRSHDIIVNDAAQ